MSYDKQAYWESEVRSVIGTNDEPTHVPSDFKSALYSIEECPECGVWKGFDEPCVGDHCRLRSISLNYAQWDRVAWALREVGDVLAEKIRKGADI